MKHFAAVLIMLCGAVFSFAQSDVYGGARDLIARVQNDLKRAADFGRNGDVKKVKRRKGDRALSKCAA